MIFKTSDINESAELNKPVFPFIILFSVIVTGTIGYSILWNDGNTTIFDALYMTFLTISTIGFKEVHSLSLAGRVFTMILGVVGIGSLFYLMSVIMENLVILQLKNNRGEKKMKKKISKFENHIIIVGLGRVGKLTARHLHKNDEKCIYIDNDISIEEGQEHHNADSIYIEGDATDEKILEMAGIRKARGLVISVANPATAVFVILTAKELNPDIFIVSRADDDHDVSKIMKAGADRVVSPYDAGGQRLANMMLNRDVIDFFKTNLGDNLPQLALEIIRLPENCPFFGKSLQEIDFRQKTGATILAIVRNGDVILNPTSDIVFQQGDQLTVFGKSEDLKQLEKLAAEQQKN